METLRYRHTSLSRGYVRKGESYKEFYHGKFGVGVKLHIANADGPRVSNNYHYVSYYLLDDDKLICRVVLAADRYAACPEGVNKRVFSSIRSYMWRTFRAEWMATPAGLYTEDKIWWQTHKHYISEMFNQL